MDSTSIIREIARRRKEIAQRGVYTDEKYVFRTADNPQ